jgi:hypothetical protein
MREFGGERVGVGPPYELILITGQAIVRVRLAMMAADESARPSQRRYAMKRLMTLMLALSFVVGSVAVVFAQDTAKKQDTTKKKTKKKSEDTEKKGG